MNDGGEGAAYAGSNDRRGAFRKQKSEPRLELDDKTFPVNDFSQTGFEAPLPEQFRRIGDSFEGIFRFDAMGSSWRQEVRFTVNRVTAKGNVAATYEVLSSSHKVLI